MVTYRACGVPGLIPSEYRMRVWLRQSKVPYLYVCQTDGTAQNSLVNHCGEQIEPFDPDRKWKRPDFIVSPPGKESCPISIDTKTAEKSPDAFCVYLDDLYKGVEFAKRFRAELYYAFSYRQAEETVYWLHSFDLRRESRRVDLIDRGLLTIKNKTIYVDTKACLALKLTPDNPFDTAWPTIQKARYLPQTRFGGG